MHIVAIGWMYVVLMMSIAEESAVAGVMTFFGYGVAPLAIILYIAGARQCKRRRNAEYSRGKPPASDAGNPTREALLSEKAENGN